MLNFKLLTVVFAVKKHLPSLRTIKANVYMKLPLYCYLENCAFKNVYSFLLRKVFQLTICSQKNAKDSEFFKKLLNLSNPATNFTAS